MLDGGDELALAPQVVSEFLHVVTDARRFQRPLTMDQALDKAKFWWGAKEVTHVYPTAESTVLFIEWVSRHGLGRKRLLDTQLAATFWAAGVRRVFTSHARDFSIFPGFQILSP